MARGPPSCRVDMDPDIPPQSSLPRCTVDEDIIRAIEEEVNSLGMNTARTSFPDDIEAFFGIYLTDAPRVEDVNRRFRLGSLRVHPDKRVQYGSKVRERCAQLQAAMCSARDALLERIEQGRAAGDRPPACRPGPWRGPAPRASRARQDSDSAGVEPRMGRWLRQSAALWASRSVVLGRVKQCGQALKHASEDLRGDREVVAVAVQQDGLALAFASPALRADQEVVSIAVKQDPLALEHAAPELRADASLALEAVRRNAFALAPSQPGACLGCCEEE